MTEFDNRADRFRREAGMESAQVVSSEQAEWAEELKKSQAREAQLKKIADKVEEESRLSIQRAKERRLKNLSQTKHYVKSLGQIWAMMRKVRLENRGWYLAAFIASVVADIATAIFGLALGVGSAVPVVGWIADILAKGMFNFVVLFFIILILMIYWFAGHYKRRRKGMILLRVSIQGGASFVELLFPLLEALPMFTASFVVNYLLALYGRAVEVMEEESKKSKVVGVGALRGRRV